jgi:hypothetical protein
VYGGCAANAHQASRYTLRMAQAARRTPALTDDTPSLDPSAIQQNYRRERARRRARVERRSATRRSNVRFWVTLLVLVFLTAFAILAAWHEVQTLFGV